MSADAAACTLRVAMEDSAAAEARNTPYARALKNNYTAFGLMQAPNCAKVAVEDILRGHTKGVFVLPMKGQLKEVLTYLPAGWAEALRAGRAGLILDQSAEGHSFNTWMKIWHRQLKALGISPSRVVYVTQNRNFQDTYNRWCEEKGVKARIAIVNYDYHLSRFCRRSWPDPAAALAEKIQSFENRNEIEKRFVCLSYKPRSLRIALLTRLIKDDYWEDGFISFGGFDAKMNRKDDSEWISGEIGAFRALNLAAGSEAYLDELIAKGQVLFGQASGDIRSTERSSFRNGDSAQYIYRRSAFSLVPETEMRPTADRITEKSLKPLANCHPAVLFANYRSLALLRSFGFKTFEPWIDEGYDRIEDPEARLLAAYGAFRQFYKTAWDRVREDRELRDVLLYNAEHAMINLPRLYEETLDRKLCREIAAVLEEA